MSKIVVIGGTGFAGGAVAREAAKRGHDVVSLSRKSPEERIDNIQYVQGSAIDKAMRAQVLDGADVVVGALSPRGDMAGKVRELYLELAKETAERGIRFVMIGGFSSLRPAAGQPRFFEGGNVPAEYLDEAMEMAGTFDILMADSPEGSEWVYISPAAVFGAYANVADTGSYRASNDVALFDEQGESKISGGDFAHAVVDEIENPAHNHENISFVQ